MNASDKGDHPGHHFHGTHYVVSLDVDLLMSQWGRSVGLITPTDDFYIDLRSRLQSFLQNIFARVTFIDSREIRQGLLVSTTLHRQAGLKVISLERAYLEDHEVDGRLELTRTVDDSKDDIKIPSVRNGTPAKHRQFGVLRGKTVALLDDVVFSGRTLISTIKELQNYGVNVHAVTAAVGVKDGVDNLKGTSFGVMDMPDRLAVECLEEFDDVSDQVCERDFFPGVPYSGRAHYLENTAFPYVLPFGLPGKWASIPEKEITRFSVLCIDNTIALFSEIERINNTHIPCSMVPRPIFGFPNDQTRFVSFLEAKRAECLRA